MRQVILITATPGSVIKPEQSLQIGASQHKGSGGVGWKNPHSKDKKSLAVVFHFIKLYLHLCVSVRGPACVRAWLVDFTPSPNCEPLSYVLLQHDILLLNVASGWTFCQGFSVSHLLTMSDNAYWSGIHRRRQAGKYAD